jgi:OOP family OmpA-OmpF porin
LLPGGFTEFCVKLAPIEIGVRAVEAAGGKRGPLSVSKLTPLAGSQQFFSFTAKALNTTAPSARQLTLQAKTRQEAELELPQTREQIHTLSRTPAVVACEDAPPIQAAVVVPPIPSPAPSAPEIITLSTDVLFQFDKAALSNISAPGRNLIDAVIGRVKSEYERIESINVVGHSDPFGKPELKQIRATERAATVRDYFLANGLQSIRVVSEGRSDKEPVVTSCDTVQTKASILCNAPNRRVVIEITGTRKKSP